MSCAGGRGVWWVVIGVLLVVLVGLVVVLWWSGPRGGGVSASGESSLVVGSSAAGGGPSVVVSSSGVGGPSASRSFGLDWRKADYWTGVVPAERLPRMFDGLALDDYRLPERLGSFPLNLQKSRIYIFVANAYYGSGDRYDPELILRIIRVTRGEDPYDEFNRNVAYFSDAHYVGRLTCGHDSVNGRFSCLAYAEDAFIQLEAYQGRAGVSEEEIVARLNEFVDHQLGGG